MRLLKPSWVSHEGKVTSDLDLLLLAAVNILRSAQDSSVVTLAKYISSFDLVVCSTPQLLLN